VARRLSAVGQFVKWFVIPIGLALAGHYLIGPRVGDDLFPVLGRKVGKPVLAIDQPRAEGPRFSEPEIEVTVQRAAYQPSAFRRVEAEPDRPTEQRRRRSAPVEPPPTDNASGPDGPQEDNPPGEAPPVVVPPVVQPPPDTATGDDSEG
jgi:hypothetical protein